MKKTALIIMVITFLSKVFGFARDIVLSYFYGATNITDAYLISQTIPSVIFGFLGVAITTAYLPILSRVRSNLGEKQASLYTSKLINFFMIAITVIFVLGITFTEPLVRIFAYGFTGETFEIAKEFTKIGLIGMYLTTLISIFRSYLNVKEKFLVPALIGIPFNLVIIISIVLSSRTNYRVLAIGTLAALASQLLFLIPFIKKEGFKYKLIFDTKDINLRKTFFVALPAILGTSVNQINILIDRTIASTLAVGGISALNYANRLNVFIEGLFVTSLITVMYPTISNLASRNDMKKLKEIIAESLNIVNIFIIPIVIGAMIFTKEIVSLLFQRGSFDVNALEMTTYSLLFYSIGLIGIGVRETLSRVFYSLQDTKTPMLNGAIGMIVNIILNFIFSRLLGIGGLALATSISAIFTSLLMLINLRKKIGPFGMKQISISFLKILFASLVMGGLAKLSFNYLTTSISQNLSLLLAIGVGALSYFVIIYFMKIEDVDVIVGAIKKKLGRGAV
ncbi:murein biosynthesis integral membrane protein MurJ [Bacteroides sp.]|uniref:murein biosynthesis integral membrane protein MurJ n=1 Tax=Bacteroides sp. TaxID=29523 RepID=UPI002622C8A0|nr:murein biosynthesis integral membrane protein MurJ [Bacteroides sp.]MDD3040956.1 murein biosynthesis integral membrane protein MurJ [Bacteroides sp.]